MAADTGKATVLAKCLEQQLSRDEPPLEPPRPLVKARGLKNGRANGPDGIPNELLSSISLPHYTDVLQT